MSETARERRCFPGIAPQAFAHPLDRTALLALQRVPGLAWIVRRFLSSIGERRMRLLFLASAVQIGPRQLPRVDTLLTEACAVLDVERPELYVTQRFSLNAAAMGVDRPFIVLTSQLVEALDDDELRCVIGHELGHVLCGHALYTTVLVLLLRMWQLFLGIPGGFYAVMAIRLALLEWSRKAELTADRAGLLVTQDLGVCYQVDMKLAGGALHREMNLDAFMAQAEAFESHGDALDGVLKLMLVAEQTHPFPVLRVAELRRWAESGDYAAILAGRYSRRGEDPTDGWLERIRATAGDYREAFETTSDPFLATLQDLGAGASAAGSETIDLVSRMFGLGKGRDRDRDDGQDDG